MAVASRRARFLILFGLTVVGAVVYYGLNLAQTYYQGKKSDLDRPAEAAVVLGAAQWNGRPSPLFRSRLDHAIALFHSQSVAAIVVTGGIGDEGKYSEAEIGAKYLLEQGIPAGVIVEVPVGNNTYESLVAVADEVERLRFYEVALVSDPFHALRCQLIARELGMKSTTASLPESVLGKREVFKRHLREAAGVSVGRIIGFKTLSGLTG